MWYQDPTTSWYYVVSKQQHGPVDLSGMVDLYEKGARGGGITDETLVWSEKMSSWTKIKVQRPSDASKGPGG